MIRFIKKIKIQRLIKEVERSKNLKFGKMSLKKIFLLMLTVMIVALNLLQSKLGLKS